jgi:hypothetical protein
MIHINLLDKKILQERERRRRWRLNNPEKAQACRRSWQKSNPEKGRAACNKFYANNTEEQLERSKQWQRNNPEIARATRHRRRARILGNGGSFTASQFVQLKNHFGNVCLCCRRTEFQLLELGLTLVPDHVLPISKGGSNDISNIQPLCHGRDGCNLHKHAKHIDYRTEGMCE